MLVVPPSMETNRVKLDVEKEYEKGYRIEGGHVDTVSISHKQEHTLIILSYFYSITLRVFFTVETRCGIKWKFNGNKI